MGPSLKALPPSRLGSPVEVTGGSDVQSPLGLTGLASQKSLLEITVVSTRRPLVLTPIPSCNPKSSTLGS